MKRIALLIGLSLITSTAFAQWGWTRSPAKPTTGTYTVTNSGAFATMQAAANNAINDSLDGDTIQLPAGVFTSATSADLITNVQGGTTHAVSIKGAGMVQPGGTKIQCSADGKSGATRLLNYNCKDANLILDISDLELFGEGSSTDGMLWLDGVQTLHTNSSGAYTGGLRIHDVNFSSQILLPGGFIITDAQITTGSNVLTSTGHTFAPGDVGRPIVGYGLSPKVGPWPLVATVGVGGDNHKITMKTSSGAAYNSTATMSNVRVGFSADTSKMGGHHYITQGWVVGAVMYHCMFDDSLWRWSAECALINHTSSPTDTGKYGDYAYSLPPGGPTAPSLAGTFTGIYIEDNFFKHTGGVTDTGSINNGGGAIVCVRHNHTFGIFSGHGTRETGGLKWGGRLFEEYNNIKGFDETFDPARTGSEACAAEFRAGEVVSYNNLYVYVSQNKTLVSQIPQGQWAWGQGSCFLMSMHPWNVWSGGADGLCPWDQNQKVSATSDGTGKWADFKYRSDQAAIRHYADDGYTLTGSESWNVNKDVVTAGVDQDPVKGDVFGHADASSGVTQSGSNGTILTGIVIHGRFNAPTATSIPTDYFRGCLIRAADLNRQSGETVSDQHFWYILGSTASTSATATSTGPITLTCMVPNLPNSSAAPNISLTAHMEIRRVQQYVGGTGTCQLDTPITPNSNPKTLGSPNPIPAPNPRYANNAQAVWAWGTRIWMPNSSTATDRTQHMQNEVLSEYKLTYPSIYDLVCPEVHLVNCGVVAGVADPSTITPSQTRPGYPWDNTIAAGNDGADGIAGTSDDVNPQTRVGPDRVFTGADGISNTGAQSSFYQKGAGGANYPHPLRFLSSNSAPAFTSSTTASWTAGQSNSFDATASGIPVPTITKSESTPSGWTFTAASGSGKATFSYSGTTTGTYTFHLTAANGIGTNATQTLTITVGAAAALNANLISPTNGQSFLTTDTISLQASASGGAGIDHVNFFQGSTQINPTNITTPVNGVYSYNWTGMAAGTYSITAKAYETGTSATATSTPAASITVTVPPTPTPTPSPAVIQVRP